MKNKKIKTVAVHIVTFNNEKTISTCLESVLAQKDFSLDKNLLLLVTDNASTDGSTESIKKFIAEHKHKNFRLQSNTTNKGFCLAHNEGIEESLKLGADAILVLNPDLRLEKDALSILVKALEDNSQIGTVCPKLYRSDDKLNPVKPKAFDSTGMFITPQIRHFDRGSEQLDQDNYEKEEFVFGASGACALYKKEFIEDVSFQTKSGLEFFDNNFFAYREDADLSWRGIIQGWKCLYVPEAVGYHKRVVTPENRKALPKKLNYFSVRNRFLLQINNFSFIANLNCILPALCRNTLVIGAVCSVERSSFSALKEVFKNLPNALKKRQQIFKKRRISYAELNSWFSDTPHSKPKLSRKPTSKKITSVTAIIVNYNSGARLKICLDHLVKTEPKEIDLTIVVADNGSTDASLSRLGKNYRTVIIEQFGKNLGFAGAINAIAEDYPADAFLILNPDIQTSAETITKLSEILDAHENLGAIAPVLKSSDEKIQLGFTARRFPTLVSTLCELFGLQKLWPSNPWTTGYQMNDDQIFSNYLNQTSLDSSPNADPEIPFVVDQPAGACLLIKAEAFNKLNGFDRKFYPAWFEDVDFCKRLFNNGYLTAITSKADAIHEGGYSYKQMDKTKFLKIWYSNQFRYWLKHGNLLELILIPFSESLAFAGRYVVLKTKLLFNR